MSTLLSVSCLSKQFADGVLPVVNGLSFEVEDGETFALLGPSGCGKTTALRCIAGFEAADNGSVTLGGVKLVDDGVAVPPERRGVGFVFQDYALFPHLSVRENVTFGLKGVGRRDRSDRAEAVLKLVGLDGLGERKPHALSGGQQQRVALARAIAPRPRLLLLDEPFSNLDALLRQEMRERVRALLKEEGMTALLVTHDQEEALSFADRVAVMQNGRIDQIGTPEQIYATPRTLFVAQFLGRTNLLLTQAEGETADTVLGRLRLNRAATGPVLLSIRPEHLALTDRPAPSAGSGHALEGTVLAREYRGHDITYRVQLGPVDCLVHTDNRTRYAPGDTVWVRALEPAVVLERVGERAGV